MKCITNNSNNLDLIRKIKTIVKMIEDNKWKDTFLGTPLTENPNDYKQWL